MSGRLILGVGLSSVASAEELADLVDEALAAHGFSLARVDAVATRSRLAADHRVTHIGVPVLAIDDDALVAATAPTRRAVGIAARVAETAALLAAGAGARLVVPTRRSPHATVAGAMVQPAPSRRSR